MNTLAFTNHLLCDVFAVTAVLREARDENSASYAPEILAAWSKVAPVFSSSGFPKFTALGSAIQQKVPLEQQMVDSYSAWAKSVSDQVLPMMEEILSDELIPQYQRAVMVAFPEIAQAAAQQTAARNGEPEHRRGPMFGVLWRTDARPVGGDAESSYSPDDRTLPVVDPELDSLANQNQYVQTAVAQRRTLSHMYLDQWNAELLSGFDQCGQDVAVCRPVAEFHLWLPGAFAQRGIPADEPADGDLREPAQTANSNATLAETLHLYRAWFTGRSCRRRRRGCSRIPWRPMTRRLPRSICSFRADAWDGSRNGGPSGGRVRSPLGGVPGQIAYAPTGHVGEAVAAAAAASDVGGRARGRSDELGTC